MIGSEKVENIQPRKSRNNARRHYLFDRYKVDLFESYIDQYNYLFIFHTLLKTFYLINNY